MNKMKTFTIESQTPAGFTLIETLIAILILTLSIVGPFQIAQGVLSSAYNARDQLVAAGLAQEAVEYARMVRDSNYLYNARFGANTVTWLNGMDGNNGPNCYYAANGSHPCVVEPRAMDINSLLFYANGSLTLCANSTGMSCPRPLYVDAYGIYNQQNSGTVSKYTRVMTLTQINAHETMVTVTVTWENHGAKSVTVSENLQDWL